MLQSFNLMLALAVSMPLIFAQLNPVINVTATWMAGSSSSNQAVSYGTPGIAYSSNTPGARQFGCTVVSLTGADRMYIYGGLSTYSLGDMWMLDIATTLWTTIHTSQPQNFGVKGMPSSSVFPGVKYGHACSSSFDGSLYLFAGNTGGGGDNNMWMFNFTTSQWTWIVGNSGTTGSYSVKIGIESSSNLPSSRFGHTMNALTTYNGFLVFGGYTQSYSFVNDVWRFNVVNGQWTWLSGSISSSSPGASYGSTPSSSNHPAGASSHSAAVAYGTDKLYMFGRNYNGGNNIEMWVFDYLTTYWTWLSTPVGSASYTGQSQYPGGRQSQSLLAIPGTSLLIMMNGNGYSYYSSNVDGLSDIWMYNTTSNTWFWLRGEDSSTDLGNYGVIGTTSNSSLPPGRQCSFTSFVKNSNLLILFGGEYNNSPLRNDVWYITISGIVLPNLPSSSVTTSVGQPITKTTTTTATATSVSSSIPTTLTLTTMRTVSTYISVTTATPASVTTDSITTRSISDYNDPSVKSSVTNTPSGSNNDAAASGAVLNMIIYLLVGILGLAVLVILGCVAKCMCLPSDSKNRQNSTYSLTKPIMSSLDIEATATTMSSMTHSSQHSGETTMMGNQTEFAVPAFLNYTSGIEFRWHTLLARGGGGEVYLGDALVSKLSEFGPKIVVKIVAPRREFMNETQAQAFDQEVAVMYYLGRHRNVAGMLGWCNQPVAMLMKYYTAGSLAQVTKAGHVNTKQLKLSFALDVSRGLQYMHFKGVAHCDIKPANILVDQDQYGRYFCALADFGISQMFTLNSQLVRAFQVVNVRGASIAFAAPEVLTRFRRCLDATREQAFAADVYSYSIVVFEILNKSHGWSKQ